VRRLPGGTFGIFKAFSRGAVRSRGSNVSIARDPLCAFWLVKMGERRAYYYCEKFPLGGSSVVQTSKGLVL
jgi:hypothetical protein